MIASDWEVFAPMPAKKLSNARTIIPAAKAQCTRTMESRWRHGATKAMTPAQIAPVKARMAALLINLRWFPTWHRPQRGGSDSILYPEAGENHDKSRIEHIIPFPRRS